MNKNYGSEIILLDTDAFVSHVGDANAYFLTLIRNVVSSDDYIPPILPEIAISLSAMANRSHVEFSEIEEVVSRDPAVAAKIVAIANSNFYNSRGTTVRSLGLAITTLGLSVVRDVAFQVVAQNRIFKVSGYTERMKELYEAGQLAGLAARELCRVLRYESEMAYLCGLLHDMGQAIILSIIEEDSKRKRQKNTISLEQLTGVIDSLHAQVGAKVVKAWGLPVTISDAIFCHHMPDTSSGQSPMPSVIAIVDLLLRHVGVGVEAQPVDPAKEELFNQLNMTQDQAKGMIEYIEKLVLDDATRT